MAGAREGGVPSFSSDSAVSFVQCATTSRKSGLLGDCFDTGRLKPFQILLIYLCPV